MTHPTTAARAARCPASAAPDAGSRPQAGTIPPIIRPGQPGRASRARRHLTAAAAGGLLAAGVIVLAAASASGASPVTGAAAASTAAYSSDVSFAASMPATLTQQVSYRTQQLHNPAGSGPGSPAAVLVELLDAAGADVSGPGITLTVTGLSPHPGPGLAPSGTFTPVNLGLRPCYQVNVDTAGYPPGTYTLSFTAGTDPATHTAQFTVP